jgi:cytochrome c peroxidase
MKALTHPILVAVALVGFVSDTLAAAWPNDVPSEKVHRTDAAPEADRAKWRKKYTRPAGAPFPADNLYSKDRELLGRTLFFDPRLSGSHSISCSSCHNPGFSWGDGLPKGIGSGMKELGRRSPTILNIAWSDLLFWDGRADSLEEQALGPIASQREMNQPLDGMIHTLDGIAEYGPLFSRAYPAEPINEKTVARAIATFERTIISEQAPFDKWISGDEEAIPSDAKRGFDLFNGKAACAQCHTGWNFTDDGFHDVGIAGSDLGRGARLPLEAMQFAFKTPTLRNIDRRAPFMHDGSEPTLAEVLDFYDKGGSAKRVSLAPEIVALHLTSKEKGDLVAFLQTLTSVDKSIEVPAFPR